jgi:hypothetical protein
MIAPLVFFQPNDFGGGFLYILIDINGVIWIRGFNKFLVPIFTEK